LLKTMQAEAVVFSDRRKVEFRDVAVPSPGLNDVVVRTRYSWISNGTEGSFLRGERADGETPCRPGDPWPFPVAAGYQSTGIVEEVGSDVEDIRPGDWVFCSIGRIEGMFQPWAGHISPKICDRSQVWLLPKGVSPEATSGLVLTQVGYNCGIRPPVSKDGVALVLGDGLVGHWAAQTLHWRGAEVILAGKHEERLALFPVGERRHTLNVSGLLPAADGVAAPREALPDTIRKAVPDGIDILVDTVGTVPTILACLSLMRHNGHIVSAGFHGTDSMLDIQRLRFGEQTLHSPSGWLPQRMDETLALIAEGHLETEPLITHRFPVERAADAWRLILERSEPVLGVLLEWP
jgi:bacteriochlorophyllide a dehydrogenase